MNKMPGPLDILMSQVSFGFRQIGGFEDFKESSYSIK